ncbi:MAG TPA: twin-arginine translocase subunit TatC [Anaerolineales bacterium]|nr:twin-arginine translocase subunit TatC [Anaerolineales bacterium]
MRRFFLGVWRVITFPFRLVWWIITLPFRAFRSARDFMLTEPKEESIGDIFSNLAQNEQARAMFWEHVEALRMHLLRSVLGIAVGVGIAFIFTQQMIDFLAIPVGGLDKLKAIEVTESVGVFMRVALLAGIALALPYVAFEFWLFAAPGLKRREKFFGLTGIPLASVFFLSGMAFTYYMLLPSALPFLLNFLGIQAQLRPESYFSFVTGLMFWIGLSFEFPLVIYVLTAIGFVQPRVLAKQWRIAVVIISIVAAAITPTVDPVNMSLVMLPMILLYFISIVLSYIAYAGRRKPAEKTSVEEGAV